MITRRQILRSAVALACAPLLTLPLIPAKPVNTNAPITIRMRLRIVGVRKLPANKVEIAFQAVPLTRIETITSRGPIRVEWA